MLLHYHPHKSAYPSGRLSVLLQHRLESSQTQRPYGHLIWPEDHKGYSSGFEINLLLRLSPLLNILPPSHCGSYHHRETPFTSPPIFFRTSCFSCFQDIFIDLRFSTMSPAGSSSGRGQTIPLRAPASPLPSPAMPPGSASHLLPAKLPSRRLSNAVSATPTASKTNRGRGRGRARHRTKEAASPSLDDCSVPFVLDDVSRDLDHFAFDSDDDDDGEDSSKNGDAFGWLSSHSRDVRDLRVTLPGFGTSKDRSVSPRTLRQSADGRVTADPPLLLASPALPFHSEVGSLFHFDGRGSDAPSLYRVDSSGSDASLASEAASRGSSSRQSSPSWSLSFSRRPSTTSGSPIFPYQMSPIASVHNRNSPNLRRNKSTTNSKPTQTHRGRSSLDSSMPKSTAYSHSSSYRDGAAESLPATSTSPSLPWLPLINRTSMSDVKHDNTHRVADSPSLIHQSPSSSSLARVSKPNVMGLTSYNAPPRQQTHDATSAHPVALTMVRARSQSDTQAMLESLVFHRG